MPSPPWANNAQLEFLKGRCVDFANHQNAKSLSTFWSEINRDFFERWPDRVSERQGLTEKEKKVLVPTDGLNEEQWVVLRIKTIYNWYNNNGPTKKKRGTAKSVKITMPQSSSRLSTEAHLYSKRYYDTRVKSLVEAEIGDRKLKPKQRIAIVNKHLTECFKNESAEVREEIKKAREEERAAKEIAQGLDASVVNAVKDLTPDQMLIAQSSLPDVLADFCEEMGKHTGWAFAIMAGGPDARKDGEITTLSVHTGQDKYGQTFRRAYKDYKSYVKTPFLKHLDSVYPKSVRDRFLSSDKEDKPSTATGSSPPPAKPITATAPTAPVQALAPATHSPATVTPTPMTQVDPAPAPAAHSVPPPAGTPALATFGAGVVPVPPPAVAPAGTPAPATFGAGVVPVPRPAVAPAMFGAAALPVPPPAVAPAPATFGAAAIPNATPPGVPPFGTATFNFTFNDNDQYDKENRMDFAPQFATPPKMGYGTMNNGVPRDNGVLQQSFVGNQYPTYQNYMAGINNRYDESSFDQSEDSPTTTEDWNGYRAFLRDFGFTKNNGHQQPAYRNTDYMEPFSMNRSQAAGSNNDSFQPDDYLSISMAQPVLLNTTSPPELPFNAGANADAGTPAAADGATEAPDKEAGPCAQSGTASAGGRLPGSRTRKPPMPKEVVPLVEKQLKEPEWIVSAHEYLKGSLDSGPWEELVNVWFKFETDSGLLEMPSQRLPAKNRPDLLSKWLAKRRQFNTIPPLDDVAAFSVEWLTWWNSIQPKWQQVSTPGTLPQPVTIGKGVEDLSSIKKAGPVGLVVAIISLKWWAGDGKNEGWVKAVEDVKGLLESMMETIANESLKRKGGLEESVSDKRKKV